jgi:FkbM family methyltransferase
VNKTYKVGRFDLTLPHDHSLDVYQRRYRLYDWILGEIASLVISKYPDAVMIDIGANVGDTAALICRSRDVPLLCIEGSPNFLPFLRTNLSKLPSCVVVVECFIGAKSGSVPADALLTGAGTASVPATAAVSGGDHQIPVRTLQDVLVANPGFDQARLIKIDTDGADFEILIASINIIRKHQPVVFFEYDPTFRKDGIHLAMKTIKKLVDAGYHYFLCYDNFGHFVRMISEDIISQFTDINRYIMSHLFFGRQIYYFDVCAFSERDKELAQTLLTFHRNMLDEFIIRGGSNASRNK